jgi:hypothetical protein
VEAASIRRATRTQHGPSVKARCAFVAYAVALLAAWSLVSGADSTPRRAAVAATATPDAAAAAPNSSDLALRTIAARVRRSVVTIGDSAGFVAWEANGLSLILTARPDSGWQTGKRRSVAVRGSQGFASEGTLVRTDPRTGLGLVRVEGDVDEPLWQFRRAAPVEPGQRLLVAERRGGSIFTAVEPRYAAIWGVPEQARPGEPVLNDAGRIVGVVVGNRVVPIGRACGTIRRC